MYLSVEAMTCERRGEDSVTLRDGRVMCLRKYARERDGGCLCVNERQKDERVFREGMYNDQRLHAPKSACV